MNRSGRGKGVSLEVWLARRGWLGWGWCVVLGGLLAAGLMADREPAELAQLGRVEMEVVEVVDAVTLRVQPAGDGEGRLVTVRLAGLAAEGRWEAVGLHVLGEELAGETVRVSWQQRQPREGGLVYLYLRDGRLVNEWLIEEGWAKAEPGTAATRAAHPLEGWFERLEGRALQRGQGAWAEDGQ